MNRAVWVESVWLPVPRKSQGKHRPWTDDEVAELRVAYGDRSKPVALKALSEKLGRDRHNVCRKARALGLTNQRRAKVEQRVQRLPQFSNPVERSAHVSRVVRQRWKDRGHPRGMLGRSHSDETKARLAATSANAWSNKTQEQKVARTRKTLETRLERGTYATPRAGTTWKAAWREIGGKRKYYRSRWEANYARYLEWLKSQHLITDWSHEPEVFWFDGIKRGSVSYLPDFRVHNTDGSVEYHEVKGWMDSRSKTKIRRMAKYHPNVKLLVIREKQYREIKNKVAGLVPGWE